ncbi:uncharacterized protein A4U43_C01F19570 [Asparagus officinalis]|uniref:WRKY domain-containing protein n=1 Tax=Asparagus officinalis TaxID=4686 RepID=A0A5P1FRG2_ASPOF|nr:WRKY transcription factor SUSIBA2-like [Asparagus officinalis]ONK80594.1 uncharacterized protein A4U43_C01F19570 [Asparagus officinalis]
MEWDDGDLMSIVQSCSLMKGKALVTTFDSFSHRPPLSPRPIPSSILEESMLPMVSNSFSLLSPPLTSPPIRIEGRMLPVIANPFDPSSNLLPLSPPPLPSLRMEEIMLPAISNPFDLFSNLLPLSPPPHPPPLPPMRNKEALMSMESNSFDSFSNLLHLSPPPLPPMRNKEVMMSMESNSFDPFSNLLPLSPHQSFISMDEKMSPLTSSSCSFLPPLHQPLFPMKKEERIKNPRMTAKVKRREKPKIRNGGLKWEVKKVCLDKNIIFGDFWAWRKYGEKKIKHSANIHREYYKCSNNDTKKTNCQAKRRIERNSDDPQTLTIAYAGEHNHQLPIRRHSHSRPSEDVFSPLSVLLPTTTSPSVEEEEEDDGDVADVEVADDEGFFLKESGCSKLKMKEMAIAIASSSSALDDED